MRAVATSVTRGTLAFAIAALDDLQALAAGYGKTSPFFNLFTSVRLGPLTSDEARALIAVSPRPFAPDDSDWILAQSQGWPVLVQLLCQTRLAALEEELSGEGWKTEGLAPIERYRSLLDGAARTEGAGLGHWAGMAGADGRGRAVPAPKRAAPKRR